MPETRKPVLRLDPQSEAGIENASVWVPGILGVVGSLLTVLGTVLDPVVKSALVAIFLLLGVGGSWAIWYTVTLPKKFCCYMWAEPKPESDNYLDIWLRATGTLYMDKYWIGPAWNQCADTLDYRRSDKDEVKARQLHATKQGYRITSRPIDLGYHHIQFTTDKGELHQVLEITHDGRHIGQRTVELAWPTVPCCSIPRKTDRCSTQHALGRIAKRWYDAI